MFSVLDDYNIIDVSKCLATKLRLLPLDKPASACYCSNDNRHSYRYLLLFVVHKSTNLMPC